MEVCWQDCFCKKGMRYSEHRVTQNFPDFENLIYLGIKDKVIVQSMALNDFRSVLQVLKEV